MAASNQSEDRPPAFHPGWLDDQIAKSIKTLDALPAGVRESLSIPMTSTRSPGAPTGPARVE